jgi:hypothetical protein
MAAGYWPLRGVALKREARGTRHLKAFVKELTPVLIVIIGGLSLGEVLFRILPPEGRVLAKESGLIAALVVAIAWVWQTNHLPADNRRAIVVQPALVRMIYMVTAILIFKGMLEDSGAVMQLSREILHWQIPLMAVTVILPFIVGGVAGITIAFVGTTFPILVNLIHTMGQSHLILPYLALGLVSGFTGVLLSPLHLCLLLSNAYFETTLLPVYRRMRVPLVVLLGGGCLYFVLLRSLMA